MRVGRGASRLLGEAGGGGVGRLKRGRRRRERV